MTSPNRSDEYGADGRLRLPGCGLPIDSEPPSRSHFLHPFSYNHFESDGLKQREIRMMFFINLVTDKPNWDDKVYDDRALAAWLEEAKVIDRERNLDGDVYFSEHMYKVCIDELRQKAELLKTTGIVNILDAELAIAKSDTIVPPALAASLRAGVEVLENIKDNDEDWQPGSNGMVLNLLDPSLFPLVHGTTRVLSHGRVPLERCASYIGQGEPGVVNPHEIRRPAYWGTRQWLPSHITWTETGPRVASYINNLRPEDHRNLYEVLGEFVAAAIPLWEECLFRGPDRRAPRIVAHPSGNDDYVLADDAEPEFHYHGNFRCMNYEWWVRNRILRWPEPSQCKEHLSRLRHLKVKPNLRKDFPGGLQVSFKLFNVCLTPEDPVYPGDSWCYGGVLNDHIVAIALYYYDAENIDEGFLSFAHVFDSDALTLQPPLSHPTGPGESAMGLIQDFESTRRWYGLPTNRFQVFGHVNIRPGRLLAFPTVFHHKPEPFKLHDPTKPGHLKVLAMYLVDPNIRVLSTDVVPPQQRDWWSRELHSTRPFSKIPQEVVDTIVEFTDRVPLSNEQGPVDAYTENSAPHFTDPELRADLGLGGRGIIPQ
ncbi:hypothetical protein Hte_010689 [Hypoxylon texense]